eukprot:scaffold77706_cov18-Phaeocystis_antarctica.AAC.1
MAAHGHRELEDVALRGAPQQLVRVGRGGRGGGRGGVGAVGRRGEHERQGARAAQLARRAHDGVGGVPVPCYHPLGEGGRQAVRE